MRILLAGGTGLVGRHLAPILNNNGHRVSLLNRGSRVSFFPTFNWDPSKGIIDEKAVQECDTIINLSGASISKGRWTAKQKRAILDSRIQSTRLLYETVKKTASPVHSFISASAIGIYGNRGEKWIDENSNPSSDFLGTTCALWEKEVNKFSALGIRTVIIRTGLVLSNGGGLLPVMKKPIELGLGAVLGSGDQYMSWIHIDDLCNIYFRAITDNSLQGTYNATAPEPVMHREFMMTLSKRCRKPLWLPSVPAKLLRLILGGKAELVLSGQRVSSKKITGTGFQFQFTELEKALENLIPGKS